MFLLIIISIKVLRDDGIDFHFSLWKFFEELFFVSKIVYSIYSSEDWKLNMMSFKSILWKGLKAISNLYFSIILLLFLAFISILGTVIEQDQSLDYYQLHYPVNQPVLHFFTWRKIIFCGLNHMYSTPWFLFLLLLFFCSLITCTFSTQLPILKYSKQWSFLYSQKSLEHK